MTANLDGKLSRAKLDNVYRTNIQSAYQAGRYAQMSRVTETMPWWRYVAVQDDRTRPEHMALHGIVRRYDDPFWRTRYPPNGFRCRCTVRPMSDAEVKRYGYDTGEGEPDPVDMVDEVTGEITPVIGQADEGWRINAGEICWQPELGKFRADLKQAMLASLGLALRDDPLAWPQIKRRLRQNDLDDMETVLWSRDTKTGQGFGNWVDGVLETRQPKGELYPVGNLPLRVLRKVEPQPRLALVTIDDQRLSHLARDVKAGRGGALTADEIKAIPSMLQNARWFSSTRNEIDYVFLAQMRLSDGKWLMVVIHPDYKLGTNLVANNIVTASVVKAEDLNMGMYKEL